MLTLLIIWELGQDLDPLEAISMLRTADRTDGDFNGDGLWNCTDIDALTAATPIGVLLTSTRMGLSTARTSLCGTTISLPARVALRPSRTFRVLVWLLPVLVTLRPKSSRQ